MNAKSVLFFSEGVSINDRLKPRFESLIDAANRQNVTVYAIDVAGLRVHSKEAETARQVNSAGQYGVGDVSRREGAYTKELEHQQEVLDSRPAVALRRLSDDTAGLFIDGSNDLSAAMRKVHDDLNTYYTLFYQPSNGTFDGTFWKLEVKLNGSKGTLVYRKGYRATPVPERAPQ